MASSHRLVGKLKAKHSVGNWWVDFPVAEKKLPFSVGGEKSHNGVGGI